MVEAVLLLLLLSSRCAQGRGVLLENGHDSSETADAKVITETDGNLALDCLGSSLVDVTRHVVQSTWTKRCKCNISCQPARQQILLGSGCRAN